MTVDTTYIAFDGILSSGKTSTMSQIVPEFESRGKTYGVIEEPVKKWVDSGLLQLYYSDVSRYGYLFQTIVFHDRIKACEEGYKKFNGKVDYVFVERTIYTDTIFMEQLYKSNQITQLEWECYQTWCNDWERFMPFDLDMILYLRPSLEVAMDRLRSRNRDGESGVTEEYQRNLFEAHDMKLRGECKFTVLEWNSDQNIYDKDVCNKLCDTIIQSVKKDIV
jgi:deoxyadenosine/deoxycytidine kinase